MPDIAMCVNTKCKQRDKCTRYLAEPNPYRQTVMRHDENDCDSFWHVNDSPYLVRHVATVDRELDKASKPPSDKVARAAGLLVRSKNEEDYQR